MYKVMLVEDETAVRKGLLHAVDWAKYDMAVGDDVANGRLALDSYRRNRFDIVITDIKMPVMDGMELIAAIRERDKETVIVVLTCLEEFGLLKKAMTLGVADYLVKLTMTDEELNGVLGKIKYELDSRRRSSAVRPALLDIGSLRTRVLKDFLVHKAYSQEEFIALERELQLGYGMDAPVAVSVFQFRSAAGAAGVAGGAGGTEPEAGATGGADGAELAAGVAGGAGGAEPDAGAPADDRQPLKDELAAAVRPLGEADLFEDGGSIALAVKLADGNPPEQWTDGLASVWEELAARWRSRYGIAVSVGCSRLGFGATALKGLYAQAVQSLGGAFFGGPGVYRYTAEPDPDGANTVAPALAERIAGLIEELGIPDEAIVSEYRTRTAAILASPERGREAVLNDFQQLTYRLSRMLDRSGDDLSDLVLACNRDIQRAESLDGVAASLRGLFAAIRRRVKAGRSYSDVISEAVDYMESHLRDDLTLKTMAERVHVSPGYFSQLFKKETEINFIDYVQLKRMEKAKELLVGTHLKSYEIAERVGFRENTYFSSVFKRSVGLSPGEYRKMWLKEANRPGQGDIDPVEP